MGSGPAERFQSYRGNMLKTCVFEVTEAKYQIDPTILKLSSHYSQILSKIALKNDLFISIILFLSLIQ